MRLLSMMVGRKVTKGRAYSINEIGVVFDIERVGVLAELADLQPGFLYFRLIDGDGREVQRGDNMIVLSPMPYTQLAWEPRMKTPGDYAVECRWETGRLLGSRYIRREA
jgi:hypothetical protein